MHKLFCINTLFYPMFFRAGVDLRCQVYHQNISLPLVHSGRHERAVLSAWLNIKDGPVFLRYRSECSRCRLMTNVALIYDLTLHN